MPGIWGAVGSAASGAVERDPTAPGDGRDTLFRGDDLAVRTRSHIPFHEDQPATAEDGSLLWIHGDPYGIETRDGYEPRSDFSVPDAEYCAGLYDEYGMGFLERLNGEFCGVVLTGSEERVRLFTDRLGTYPLFYAHADAADGERGARKGPLLFSSRLQWIGLHPAFSPSFDPDGLAEFFSVQKTFGTTTPVEGVQKVPPAGILSADLDGSVDGSRVYWRPEYRPVERSATELAETVVETFRAVFEERVRDDLEYGVLLSGGSDSRLLLASMLDLGRAPTTFHMSDWMSTEARTAERAAMAADAEFRLLRRGPDYHERLLESVPRFSNYIGVFDEAIGSGFADELSSVDVALTGYLGDTMFGRFPLRLRKPLPPLPLHVERPIDSVPEYVDWYLTRYSPPNEVPAFLDAPDVSAVVRRHIVERRGSIEHHGVAYPSVRELQLCEYYPLTNQFAWANTASIRRITGHWSPFFDRRLIDLHLSIPVRERVRRDPIDAALARLSPTLAGIPHAGTGVPIDRSIRRGARYALDRARGAVRNRLRRDPPPARYVDHGPWANEAELIRHREFIGETIEDNRDLVESLPFLDGDGIDRCYRQHLEGENNWRDLYALATFLETPLARRVGAESG
jgi:asparagine synthase (glutamine-hydrolysing)